MISMLYMMYEVMNILLKKKEIEMIVKDKGLNFNQWKDDVVNSARMSIIDKPVSYTHLTLPTNREV